MEAASAYTRTIWAAHSQRWQEMALDSATIFRLATEACQVQGPLPKRAVPHVLTHYEGESAVFTYAIHKGVLFVGGEDQIEIPLIHTLCTAARAGITVGDVYGNLWHVLGRRLHVDVHRAAFPRGRAGAPVKVSA